MKQCNIKTPSVISSVCSLLIDCLQSAAALLHEEPLSHRLQQGPARLLCARSLHQLLAPWRLLWAPGPPSAVDGESSWVLPSPRCISLGSK